MLRGAAGLHLRAPSLKLEEHWIGQSLQLHCHPFGGQLSAVRLSGDLENSSKVLVGGVVCNISEPPGLLLTDVHIAPSFTGGFLVLEDLGEAVDRSRGSEFE